MAITIGTETLSITTEERTWRISIETPKNAVPVITVFRETVKSDAAGAIISKERTAQVSRAADVVAAETQDFTPSQAGKITAAELAALIAARADLWREQDLAAETAHAG